MDARSFLQVGTCLRQMFTWDYRVSFLKMDETFPKTMRHGLSGEADMSIPTVVNYSEWLMGCCVGTIKSLRELAIVANPCARRSKRFSTIDEITGKTTPHFISILRATREGRRDSPQLPAVSY